MRKKKTRARGYISNWTPHETTTELVNTARRVIDEYRDYLPITLRQLYYRLVAMEVVGKTEKDYSRLLDHMGNARRAGAIPFEVFRDDGFTQNTAPGWSSSDHLYSAIRSTVSDFTLDRQAGQPQKTIVWCEAAGMVPQLERVAHECSIQVLSSSGFDSITAKHGIAKQMSTEGRPVEVLHIGDYDPSGVHVFGALDEDIRAFIRDMGGDVTFTRLAVTPEQIAAYTLPQAPVKQTDKRSFSGKTTTQAEALDPAILSEILRTAIVARTDDDMLQSVIAREADIRDELMRKFA